MNEMHLKMCSSAEWAEAIERWIIPWVLESVELGDDVIEVGPGPGLTTEVLRSQVQRLTAVELDDDMYIFGRRSLQWRRVSDHVAPSTEC